jgi:hypothetical protein
MKILPRIFRRAPNDRRPTKAGPSAMNAPDYPWYMSIEGDDIEQGDIFEDCPVFLPPSDLMVGDRVPNNSKFTWITRDLIVMSQSCDLPKDREKVEDVLLCAVWRRSELRWKDQQLEEARKGRMPAHHVIAASDIAGLDREVRVVDFRRIHSLPLGFLRERARATKRLRLLPPYREHLSQSFARFFMRVGLPVDIPSFTKKTN